VTVDADDNPVDKGRQQFFLLQYPHDLVPDFGTDSQRQAAIGHQLAWRRDEQDRKPARLEEAFSLHHPVGGIEDRQIITLLNHQSLLHLPVRFSNKRIDKLHSSFYYAEKEQTMQALITIF